VVYRETPGPAANWRWLVYILGSCKKYVTKATNIIEGLQWFITINKQKL
jgi:hypothetical protein